MKQFRDKTYNYWTQWIKKRIQPANPQRLHAKNIYILPSGMGWAYGLLVVSLFTGAINYQISMIFLMTFLLAVIGLVSAWEAHANLKELSVQFISVEDTQLGTPAQLTLLIRTQQKIRFGLEFQVGKQAKIRVEQISGQGQQITLPIETSSRGYFLMPPIIVSSPFPFGIFSVWSYVFFNEHYYVYPQPVDPGFWPLPVAQEDSKESNSFGQDELYDLKQVENPWVQPNRIAWKIAAKGQGWYLKRMSNTTAEYWLFRLRDLPTGDLESKLQHLCYWLQTAEVNGYVYGLELGSLPIKYDQGMEHLKQLERQLAMYQ